MVNILRKIPTSQNTPKLPAIDGVLLGVSSARTSSKVADLLFVTFDEGTSVAGVFTQSVTCSANVSRGRTNLSHGYARALVVNSGNANAFNGSSGPIAVNKVEKLCSEMLQCDTKEVYFSSTGVIGQILPIDDVIRAIEEASNKLSDDNWDNAAYAIMTTDIHSKMTTRTATIDGKKVTINTFAKGAGMIAPNMATMLCYVFTNANINPSALQSMLNRCTQTTFNSITVDGDTSTSDTVLAFATNKAGNSEDADMSDFEQKLHSAMLEISHMIVKDGEGAKKFVQITVDKAISYESAHYIAMNIANSALVKTAFAGSDPNWGRIVMAIGKSYQKIGTISIIIGSSLIVDNNELNRNCVMADVQKYMSEAKMIDVYISVGIGEAKSTVWTCDFNKDYIKFNSQYHT